MIYILIMGSGRSDRVSGMNSQTIMPIISMPIAPMIELTVYPILVYTNPASKLHKPIANWPDAILKLMSEPRRSSGTSSDKRAWKGPILAETSTIITKKSG